MWCGKIIILRKFESTTCYIYNNAQGGRATGTFSAAARVRTIVIVPYHNRTADHYSVGYPARLNIQRSLFVYNAKQLAAVARVVALGVTSAKCLDTACSRHTFA